MSGSVFIFNHDLKAALKKEEDEQRDDSSMVIHVDHSFRDVISLFLTGNPVRFWKEKH